MFTFPLLSGDADTVFAARNSIVLTTELAEKLFGSEDPIGQSVIISNSGSLIVTGVMENVPSNSFLQFEYLAPMALLGPRQETSWSYEPQTYLLLEDNVSTAEFSKKISGFIMEHDKRTNQTVTLGIMPLTKLRLYSLNGTDPIIYIYIFLTIAAAVLLIACINFINLSTARSNTRAREIGLRKVIGARKSDIIKQFLGESIILSLISLALSVGLVLLLPAFNALSGKGLRSTSPAASRQSWA